VIATGRLSTFPGKSTYQMVVETLEPAGVGALMAMLDERRKRLSAEGLFDEARKRPLPFLPGVIGVVTSPTGAVIRDILHRLGDRFPARVVVWPVRVQGETSAAEVAAAIAGFNALPRNGMDPRPDLLIVARGGGSLEDLWGFNEEIVVRAAAASVIPLISAVGHETDWTLLDMVADHRAPTPTAAAERAVPVRRELVEGLEGRGSRLRACVSRGLERRRTELRSAERGLGPVQDLVALPRQRFDEAAGRLPRALVAALREGRGSFARAAGRLNWRNIARAMALSRERLGGLDRRRRSVQERLLQTQRRRLDGVAGRLRPELSRERARREAAQLAALGARQDRAFSVHLRERHARLGGLAKLFASLNYRNVLARGFAIVKGVDGRPVHSAELVSPGMRIEVDLADGSFGAIATGRGAAARRSRARAQPSRDQVSLFETGLLDGSPGLALEEDAH